MIFCLGTLSASLVYEVGKITSETPISVVSNPVAAVSDTFSAVTTGRSIERTSPGDHVKESQIKVFDSRIELDIANAIWAKYKNTNSMDPFLDEGANGIEIIPNNESDVKIGDIISYELDGGIVIHRVISVGNSPRRTGRGSQARSRSSNQTGDA